MNVLEGLIVPKPHPSRGGSRGYSFEFRIDVLRRDLLGQDTSASVSRASKYRWQSNGLFAKRRRGNRSKTGIRAPGHEHQVLALGHRREFPDATLDEIAAFVLEHTGVLYSRQEVSSMEKFTGLTRKVCLSCQCVECLTLTYLPAFFYIFGIVGAINHQ